MANSASHDHDIACDARGRDLKSSGSSDSVFICGLSVSNQVERARLAVLLRLLPPKPRLTFDTSMLPGYGHFRNVIESC